LYSSLPTEKQTKRKNILFIGDSLTAFHAWQAGFPEHLVTNMGVAGETVQGLLRRLDRVTGGAVTPELIFLMTGINNIAMEDYDIVEPYGRVLQRIISAWGNARLIVQSILPVLLPWIDNGIIERTNRSLRESAQACGAEYLDIYRLFVDPTGSAVAPFLLEDGIHLSGQGYEVWSRAAGNLIAGLSLPG